jgi:hypothetical protein
MIHVLTRLLMKSRYFVLAILIIFIIGCRNNVIHVNQNKEDDAMDTLPKLENLEDSIEQIRGF